jgi:hypothetical protein
MKHIALQKYVLISSMAFHLALAIVTGSLAATAAQMYIAEIRLEAAGKILVDLSPRALQEVSL